MRKSGVPISPKKKVRFGLKNDFFGEKDKKSQLSFLKSIVDTRYSILFDTVKAFEMWAFENIGD